jgi:hypothetical protein
MSQKTEILKPVPSGISKGKAYTLFNHLSRDYVKKTMHWIQIECNRNPNVSDKEVKKRHTLNSLETKELFKSLGSPSGYKEV